MTLLTGLLHVPVRAGSGCARVPAAPPVLAPYVKQQLAAQLLLLRQEVVAVASKARRLAVMEASRIPCKACSWKRSQLTASAARRPVPVAVRIEHNLVDSWK